MKIGKKLAASESERATRKKSQSGQVCGCRTIALGVTRTFPRRKMTFPAIPCHFFQRETVRDVGKAKFTIGVKPIWRWRRETLAGNLIRALRHARDDRRRAREVYSRHPRRRGQTCAARVCAYLCRPSLVAHAGRPRG